MRKGVGILAVVGALLVVVEAWSNNRTEDPLGVAVSPQTLILGLDQGGAVTVHTAIPLAQVDRASLELNGIAASATWADSRGNLVARFSESEVEAIVAPPHAVLTLTGLLTSGEPFTGSDAVRVVE